MALWLATLQVILDRGQQDDWFNARWICWASVDLAGLDDRLHRLGIARWRTRWSICACCGTAISPWARC